MPSSPQQGSPTLQDGLIRQTTLPSEAFRSLACTNGRKGRRRHALRLGAWAFLGKLGLAREMYDGPATLT